MTETEYEARIKALEEAQKRDRKKIAKLEAKHKADKAEIHNLKRRKAPKPAAPAAGYAKAKPLSAKKKEKMLRSMKPLGLSDLQKEKLEELFPGITSTSSLFD